jgi:hypothetical protein
MNPIGRLLILLALLSAMLFVAAACQPVQRPGPVRGNGDAIRAAFAQTAAVPTVRVTSTISMAGELLLNMSSAVQGESFRMAASGPALAAWAGDSETPLEVIHIDGRTFLRNAGGTTAAPDRWREVAELPLTDPAGQMITEDVGRTLASGSLVTGYIAAGPLWCTAYRARPALAAAVLAQINAYYEARGRAVRMLSGEIQFVICDDGYVHRMAMTTSNIATNRPGFETTVTTEVRLTDFGADIVIEPPPRQADLEARRGYSL